MHHNAKVISANTYAGYPTIVTLQELEAMREHAHCDPHAFWLKQAERIHWYRKPTQTFSGSFEGDVSIRWYEDGQLNASVSCLDRHLAERAEQVALISQREGRQDIEKITYADLLARVCRVAHALKSLGVEKGQRVAICLPMVSEAVVTMLACARIGAVHVVLFGGFSAEGIAERLVDSGAVAVVTANAAYRGPKLIPFKETMDEALQKSEGAHKVRSMLVVRTTNENVSMQHGRDHDFHEYIKGFATEFTPVIMDAEDPFFMLYTSGSTGKPKAIVHTCGGYLVWASYTMGMIYTHQRGDVLWCTADVAWITGHTSVLYGPLCNGGTTMISDSLPNYPVSGRWWDLVEQCKVTMFFTAPTAVRALMAEGDDVVKRRDLSSLKLLGVAGEPTSPDGWAWYHDVVGQGRCPVIDTWWQTETGGPILGAIPGVQSLKPGSATTPLPGISMSLIDQNGSVVEGSGEGGLFINKSWPGQARTIWGDHERFRQTYFTMVPGRYFSGDAAQRDDDGYYWLMGRMDDVINIAGHRLGTAEVEDALAEDHRIVESAAVGVSHGLKGQGLVVFVIVRKEAVGEVTEKTVSDLIVSKIGRYAVPESVYLVPDLPRTRSGKIVRRLLRKIAEGHTENLGDLSSLNDMSVVGMLCERVKKQKASS